MNEAFVNVIVTNGIFAVLFVSLLAYLLRDSSAREKKYQGTIEKLSEHLKKIEEVKNDTGSIKAIIVKRGER